MNTLSKDLINRFCNAVKEEDILLHEMVCKKGLLGACIDQRYLNGLDSDFNVMLPPCKIYEQRNGFAANLYAFLRVIKDNLASNMHVDINGIDLSASYLEFYDQLEKVNYVYDKLLELSEITYDDIVKYVENYIGIYGTFSYGSFLVQKYGLVLTEEYPEVPSSFDSREYIALLQKKIKIDALELKRAKENGEDVVSVKERLLKSAYVFLTQVFGNPPKEFVYAGKTYTPESFRDTFLTLDLNQFVTVSLNDVKSFQDSYSYVPAVYTDTAEKMTHMDKELLKKAIVYQLKQGMSVWVSVEESEMTDMASGVLSDKTHNYEKYYHIPELSSEELLQLNLINYDHAMAITGAKVEKEGIATRFLLDNSLGVRGPLGGRVMMEDSFFDKYVLTAVLYEPFFHKK